MYYKINQEDKDKMVSEAGFKTLRGRNTFLEKQLALQEDDLKRLSKQIWTIIDERDAA